MPRRAVVRVVLGGLFHAIGVTRLATGTGGRPGIALTCGARAVSLDVLLGFQWPEGFGMDSSARTPTRATPTLCAPSATSAGALAPSWRRAAVVVSAVGAGVLLWAATAAAAPIAWKACKGAHRAAVRPRRGPAGLVAAWRSDDLAVGDPAPGQPAGAADRVVVRELRRSWGGRGGDGQAPRSQAQPPGAWSLRRRELGSARDRREHPHLVLCQ